MSLIVVCVSAMAKVVDESAEVVLVKFGMCKGFWKMYVKMCESVCV